MQLCQYLIPLNTKTVHLLHMRLLDLLQLLHVPLSYLLNLPLLGELSQRLYFPLTSFSLHILPAVLVLFLLHNQLVSFNINL